MNRLQATALSLLALLVLRGEDEGCDSSVVSDPTFDLWCGDELCAWDVEAGSVKRVSTWHRSDYGAELVGDPVVLSQAVMLSDPGCLEVRFQAEHDAGVELSFEIDFFADGRADHVQPMTSDGYRQETIHLRTPTWFRNPRFAVRKRGAGRAVVAELKINTVAATECEGPAIDLTGPRPAGAPCERADQCASALCSEVRQWREDVPWSDDNVVDGEARVCSACGTDAQCKGSEVCGLSPGPKVSLYLHRACVAPGSAALGRRCAKDAECATGVCCTGVCSQCCPGSAGPQACATGQCEVLEWQALGTEYQLQPMPAQCAPRGGLGESGAWCLDDSDCSGSCQGGSPLKVCFLDGRWCSDYRDCPSWPSACLELGKAGGRCD